MFNGNATAYGESPSLVRFRSLNCCADWVLNQGTIFNTNSSGGELALVLTQNNGGTRISSTRYVHYGKITATSALLVPLNFPFEINESPVFLSVKTGRWNGVVTAFITMSGIKDEIDWEFPGADTTTGQTNFFWQGNVREFSSNGVCRRLTYGQPIRLKAKLRMVSLIPTLITMLLPCVDQALSILRMH